MDLPREPEWGCLPDHWYHPESSVIISLLFVAVWAGLPAGRGWRRFPGPCPSRRLIQSLFVADCSGWGLVVIERFQFDGVPLFLST
jgi:hypothetical protein